MLKPNRGTKTVLSADCADEAERRISDASKVYRDGSRQFPAPASKKKGEREEV